MNPVSKLKLDSTSGDDGSPGTEAAQAPLSYLTPSANGPASRLQPS